MADRPRLPTSQTPPAVDAPAAEPAWSDQRIRAVALELAIKRAAVVPGSESLELAERYRRFIAGEARRG